jgi:hypothetical protein
VALEVPKGCLAMRRVKVPEMFPFWGPSDFPLGPEKETGQVDLREFRELWPAPVLEGVHRAEAVKGMVETLGPR